MLRLRLRLRLQLLWRWRLRARSVRIVIVIVAVGGAVAGAVAVAGAGAGAGAGAFVVEDISRQLRQHVRHLRSDHLDRFQRRRALGCVRRRRQYERRLLWRPYAVRWRSNELQ